MIEKIYFNINVFIDNYAFYLSLYNLVKFDYKFNNFEEFYLEYKQKENILKLESNKLKYIEFHKKDVIKPIIYHLEFLKLLIDLKYEIIIYYDDFIPNFMEKSFKLIKFIKYEEFLNLISYKNENSILIDYYNNNNIKNYILKNSYLNQEESTKTIFDIANILEIKNFNLKDLNYVDLKKSNLIYEKKFYNNIINFDKEIPYSKVIGGKKIGKKLGIPTANLDITDEKVLNNILPGIYKGKCIFKKNENESLDCIISFGFNPQYNERLCKFEVLVCKNYDNKEFYGEFLKVKIEKLIRYEAKFYSFSQFIETMILDISIFYNDKLIT